MKLTDPGPKLHSVMDSRLGIYMNWNYCYYDNDYHEILKKITKYEAIGLKVHHRIIFHSEINDIDLMESVKKRDLYGRFNNVDVHFIRALHQAYNFERAGQMLLEVEATRAKEFDTIVYIRPDIMFTGPCKELGEYVRDKVILAEGELEYSNDHFAIIPRYYMKHFFFDRMELYRTNTEIPFTTAEEMYWHTIDYRVEKIAPYYIKRQIQVWGLQGGAKNVY